MPAGQHNDATKGGSVQGTNRGHAIIIPDVLIDIYARIIGIYALGVYCAIVRHYNRHTRKSYPSIDLMGTELDSSPRQTKRAIKVLRAHCMIVVWKEGRHNVYRPLHHRCWRTTPNATGAQVAPVMVPDRPLNHIAPDDAPNTVVPGSHPGASVPGSLPDHVMQGAHTLHDDPTPAMQHNDAPDTAVPHGQTIGESDEVPPPNHIRAQRPHTDPTLPTGHPQAADPGDRTGAPRIHQSDIRKRLLADRGFQGDWIDDPIHDQIQREIQQEIRLGKDADLVCEGYALLAAKWGRAPVVGGDDRAVVESRLEDGYTAGYLLNASDWWVQAEYREDYSLAALCVGVSADEPNLKEFGRAVLARIEWTLGVVISSAKRALSAKQQVDIVGTSLSGYVIRDCIDTDALATWLSIASLRPPEENLDDLGRLFNAQEAIEWLRKG